MQGVHVGTQKEGQLHERTIRGRCRWQVEMQGKGAGKMKGVVKGEKEEG